MKEMRLWNQSYNMSREQHKAKWFNQLKKEAHLVIKVVKIKTKVKYHERQKEKEVKLNQVKTKRPYSIWKWRKSQDKCCDSYLQ